MLSERAKAFSVASLLRKRSSEEIHSVDQRSKILKLDPLHLALQSPEDDKNVDESKGRIILKNNEPTIISVRERETPLCRPFCISDGNNFSPKWPPSQSFIISNLNYRPHFDDQLINREVNSIRNRRVIGPTGITCSLANASLWSQFHKHQTEMIITKTGRRMFPVIKIQVSGMDPDAPYNISLTIRAKDDKRYRYSYASSQWIVSGSGEPIEPDQRFQHPDSPSLGKEWMNSHAISFDKLKLTNSRSHDTKGQIFLHSMHQYVPEICIERVDENLLSTEHFRARRFTFNETAFVTVTAYQNQRITKLKINSNPFAKGFREISKSKYSMRENYPEGRYLHEYLIPRYYDQRNRMCYADSKLFCHPRIPQNQFPCTNVVRNSSNLIYLSAAQNAILYSYPYVNVKL